MSRGANVNHPSCRANVNVVATHRRERAYVNDPSFCDNANVDVDANNRSLLGYVNVNEPSLRTRLTPLRDLLVDRVPVVVVVGERRVNLA